MFLSALFMKSLKHLPNAADHAGNSWQFIKEKERVLRTSGRKRI
jgi:hypothetical protein